MINNPKFRAKVLYPMYVSYMKMLGLPLHLPYHHSGQDAADIVKATLLKDEPCMICRYGSIELQIIVAYLNMRAANTPLKKIGCLLKGEPVSFNKTLREKFSNNAGFFPTTEDQICRFAELMLEESKLIDVIGVWRAEQVKVAEYFPQATFIPLDTLETYTFEEPWSAALKHRKVLVIHPFTDTIKKQYTRREKIFKNPNILPEFELITLKAVQSAAGNNVEYGSWFDALQYMRDEIEKIDFDIAIIGAGAYGFPLAAHVKSIGRKAVHMGGVSQLLFGIKGNRWDGHEFYENLYNEYWTRASATETPANCKVIEGATYW